MYNRSGDYICGVSRKMREKEGKAMKKKILIVMLASILAVSSTACGGSGAATDKGNSAQNETEPEYKTLPDSQSLAEQIKAVNSNVGEIEAFDESTDPNGNLGRPGEYISKADFEDMRLEQYGEYYTGGTIETFESKSDCDNRYEYLKALQDSSLGAFGVNQYIYKYDTAIFRIEYDLTPDQAEEYHEQIDTIMGQYQDISTQESDTGEEASPESEQ